MKSSQQVIGLGINHGIGEVEVATTKFQQTWLCGLDYFILV